MKIWKKRLAVLLCAVMTLGLMYGAVPQMATEAKAASTTVSWAYPINDSNVKGSFTVEAGQKFYIGDHISTSSLKYLSSMTGAQYKNSNTKVATINRTSGLTSTKKAGTTTVTATYKGKKLTCKITVVKAGSLGSTKSSSKKAASYITSYTKGFTGKITASNRYKMFNNMIKLQKNFYKTVDQKYATGFLYTGEGYSKKLVIANMGRMNFLQREIDNYVKSSNPIGTAPAKFFKISSASGTKNKNTVSVKLKSKVTATQIFDIQADTAYGKTIKNQKKASFSMYIEDLKDNKKYRATATATLNSNALSIKLSGSTKLKSGHKYRLVGQRIWMDCKYGWTKGKTFAVK